MVSELLGSIIEKLERDLESTQRIIPLFKAAIAESKAVLAQQFHENAETDDLVFGHSDFMDSIMRLAWQRFSWDENLKSWRKSRISLIAVGGYGRRELLPHSDIDLLILLERNNHAVHRANIQSFITLLWDIGLEVGHSARSISDCRSQATADVTVLTAMMEARTIVGDDDLLQKMNKQISPRRIWPAKAFYNAKRDEQQARHHKSAHTESSLEPSVKSSPGGLRDIQTLIWVTRRQYNMDTFTGLADQDILTRAESDALIEARKFLWRIRFVLHILSDRDENRLLFDYQPKVASMFGYEDGEQLAVEQFMQRYYRTAQRVNTINETLMQHFNEVIVQAGSRLKVQPLNDRFRLVNSQLEVTSEDVFEKHPSALLEMFVIAGSEAHIEGFRASTIRLAQQNRWLIDDEFRNDPRNARLFIQLLGAEHRLFTQLRRMTRWGILGRYLPEFGRVIGQMQFDLFHIYTVDAHTLQVVRNMRRFRYKNNEQQFPVAAHIHPRLPRVELLYIAGLYHDIAKGMGGDHSELGVEIARAFCERHELSSWETNIVCWLVRNHLVMSTTAQRKDIQDPEIIHEFATFVGDKVKLDYLYALTVADINATNPTLWNGWRASLMRQLYSETKKALRHGLENVVDRDEYIREQQERSLARLEEHDINPDVVRALWKGIDDDYFVRQRESDIVWQTQAIIEHDSTEPLLVVHNDVSRRSDSGFTQLFLHTEDRKNLFVAIVTAIDHLGLDIVDAGIATSEANKTFLSFTVLDSDGQPVSDKPSRIEKIRSTIIDYLGQKDIRLVKNRRTPRVLKQFKQKTQVSISQDENHPVTALEVTTPDRPGLLSLIATIFMDLEIYLVSARITTLGERVEDVFYVTDDDGLPLTDPELLATLRERICEELDEHIEKIAV
ncbi:MAG: [protein-PII] uridylyltransferase [Proteobacteria bacterium]|nr:[protein-PII] uridylyltransferase [Pseudomonadota bacterium]